ncbi:MAG: thioesterase family protein [Acidimicrobiia bacterium]|nr:thioesterase family protein [Acidimicrobiia bacterium]
MKDSLAPGVTHEFTVEVTRDMSPEHLAPMVVLSTPKMIELMEQASLEAAQPHLDDTETTVGTHVNVSHDAAAAGGEAVTVTSQLVSVERRRLTFSVSARAGDRALGRGTHERAVVNLNNFG